MSETEAPARRRRLGELLIEGGLLSEVQLKAALNEQRKWGGRLGRTVVEMGFVKEADVVQVLAQQLRLRTVDLDQVQIPEGITGLLRLDLAERYGVFPLGVNPQTRTLLVATSDPTNLEHLQELEFATEMRLELAIATPSSIDRAIRKHYFGESVVSTATIRPQTLGVHETTFELNELLGEPVEATPASPSPASAPPPGQGDVAALAHEVTLLREQVQALEAITSSQVRSLRALLELLTESGLLTRDEYLERLHRPDERGA